MVVAIDVRCGVPAAACRELKRDCGVCGSYNTIPIDISFDALACYEIVIYQRCVCVSTQVCSIDIIIDRGGTLCRGDDCRTNQ